MATNQINPPNCWLDSFRSEEHDEPILWCHKGPSRSIEAMKFCTPKMPTRLPRKIATARQVKTIESLRPCCACTLAQTRQSNMAEKWSELWLSVLLLWDWIVVVAQKPLFATSGPVDTADPLQ